MSCPNQEIQNKPSQFLFKLRFMIEDPSNKEIIKMENNYAEIHIKNSNKFQEILSYYFNHSNFNSFIRQLNWFGFKKKKGLKKNVFIHQQLAKIKNQTRNNFSILDLQSSRGKQKIKKTKQHSVSKTIVKAEENNSFVQQFPEHTVEISKELKEEPNLPGYNYYYYPVFFPCFSSPQAFF